MVHRIPSDTFCRIHDHTLAAVLGIFEDTRKPGLIIFDTTSIKLKIVMEHIESICSLESELFFVSIRLIRILDVKKVIAKIVNPTQNRPVHSLLYDMFYHIYDRMRVHVDTVARRIHFPGNRELHVS